MRIDLYIWHRCALNRLFSKKLHTFTGPWIRAALVICWLRLGLRFSVAATRIPRSGHEVSVCRKSVITPKILIIQTPYYSCQNPKCSATHSRCCFYEIMRIQWIIRLNTSQVPHLRSAAPVIYPPVRLWSHDFSNRLRRRSVLRCDAMWLFSCLPSHFFKCNLSPYRENGFLALENLAVWPHERILCSRGSLPVFVSNATRLRCLP